MLDDVERIKEAVEQARNEYDGKVRQKSTAFWALPSNERQDLLRTVSAELRASLDMIQPKILSPEEVLRISASYAYISDMDNYNTEHSRFLNKGTE